MTFLDDFKASFKLQGIILASELLNTVPDPLLLRTGVGKLLLAVREGLLFPTFCANDLIVPNKAFDVPS